MSALRDSAAEFFRVMIKVRPLPMHPPYYDWQLGQASVCLYAESGEDADRRAKTIVANLPYEIVNDQQRDAYRGCDGLVGCELQTREVMQTGLSIVLLTCPTGAEEGNFAD